MQNHCTYLRSLPVLWLTPSNMGSFNGGDDLPISSTEESTLDEPGEVLGFNIAIELLVCGPQVRQGYWPHQ